ncbi:fatty acid desaturase [Dolichospermum circinale CS-534/05]|uniref:fatty acid desaturase family protein n=2 Tax=Dolichospermum circinale TaxID=109265 RepID=UPI00232C2FC8|nr:fatty acid desaturase [Dolichospermum circinale]MDB9454505.1 fatty acid desaturase [Dolichospermum circinale CS-541/06]MDB9467231.1 fatty acid desaturase [Dolichospermum circinale CS-539/09]MDB9470366.1 fatty acid desaturase [Dolichospermum circinale CS-539]MDB9489656.1 fatty acid desaturase [Dolichospermum circinale CS-534/05]
MIDTISLKDLNFSYYILHKKPLWNVVVISYIGVSYCGSFVLLLSSNICLNTMGCVLLSHSLTLSAYLSHEFMHGTIFEKNKWNIIGGNIMLWLNGGCYSRFKSLVKEHIFHHINKVDSVTFDLPTFINQIPKPICRVILTLEWLYFPAISFIFQWLSITAPFWNPQRRDERLYISIVFIMRSLLFILLGLVSPKALVLYFLAYIGMITVMRVMDAFQHTYEALTLGSQIPKHNQAYEQANTFTCLISQRYWWLNLLMLNFGYHNAHHIMMKCPWYSLHELDRDLSSRQKIFYLTLPEILKNYHRFRVFRILLGQGQGVDKWGNLQIDTFYGAIGVSFLVKS